MEGVAVIYWIALWVFVKFKKDELWWNERQTDINNTEQTLVSNLYNSHVIILLSTILVLVLGINWYSHLGQYGAEHQKEFLVFKPTSFPSEVAVIRNYGEYLYAVPFNRATKEFENKLVIIKMSESSKPPLTLSLEMIGPLKEISSKAVP
jgi:hypothetical protein